MCIGINKNLAISKRIREIGRRTIEAALKKFLNYHSIVKAAAIMTYLASFVHKKSERKIGYGLVNAVAFQCILNVSKLGSSISISNLIRNHSLFTAGSVHNASSNTMSLCPNITAFAGSIWILNMSAICSPILVVVDAIKREEHFARILVLIFVIQANANPVISKDLLSPANVANHREQWNAAKNANHFNAVKNVKRY